MMGSQTVLCVVLLCVTSVLCCVDDSGLGLEERIERSDAVLIVQALGDVSPEGGSVNFRIIDIMKEDSENFHVDDLVSVQSPANNLACWKDGSTTPKALFIRNMQHDNAMTNDFPLVIVSKNNRAFLGKLLKPEGFRFSAEMVFDVEERSKRSVENSELLTDENLSLNGEETIEVENVNNTSPTPGFSRRTLPTPSSSVRPARTLPSARTISQRTLPSAARVEISTKTLPNGKVYSTPPKTLPSNVRVTLSPRTFPSRLRPAPRTFPTFRPFSRSPRTLPPRRTLSRSFFNRVLPSSRPRPTRLSQRTLPTRRFPISRLRPTLPTPRKMTPRTMRVTNLSDLNLPPRRTLPRGFRNPRPTPQRFLPEARLIPTKALPTPNRSIMNRIRLSRVLPTSSPRRSRMSFIHIGESSQNRGYDGTVVGCPTVTGEFDVTTMTRNRFYGVIRIPPLKYSMTNGWLIKMKFNIPLKDISSNVLSKGVCSSNSREYCFVPNDPATVIEQEQGFSAFISGNFSRGLRITRLRSTVKLMGVCSGPAFEVEPNNLPGIFRDFNNDRLQVTEEEEEAGGAAINSEVTTTTQPDRCQSSAPNGGLAAGGNTIPDWEASEEEGAVDYNELLHKSILFYEAQRSGSLSPENRIPWRGDADLKDGCSIQADLTGGWYNAGGDIKSTPLIAFSTTLLAWGAIEYQEAYVEAGEMGKVLEQLRWATDYLIKCRTSPTTLVVQIGDSMTSLRNWGRPEQTDSSTRNIRVADPSKPAADVAGEVAAALAAASILFNHTDPTYAEKCLEMARELFEFAQANPKRYNFDRRDSGFWYVFNHNYKEELAWAAVWLYRATGEEDFLSSATDSFSSIGTGSYLFSMKQKSRAIAILLASETNNRHHRRLAEQYINWFIQRSSTNTKRMLFLASKGANMYRANAAFLALFAARNFASDDDRVRTEQYSQELMETLVGVSGQGYVVGVGRNPPKRPHHQGSICPILPSRCQRSLMYRNQNNPHVLYGALVSGIDRIGRYSDRASDSLHNAVRIDYNAGFQGLAAGIIQSQSQP